MNYLAYFKSLEERLYKVEILTDEKQEWKEVTLAGEQPVVISYLEPDFLFSPIRKSTCTVKMLTDGYPLELFSAKPDGTKLTVSVQKGDKYDLVWTGFLQPNLYNQGYCNPIEELELVFEDYISILQYYDFDLTNKKPYKSSIDFLQILKKICTLSEMPLCDGFYYNLYRVTLKDEKEGLWASSIRFKSENFYSSEGEPWSYFQVLEEICKYLGLTAIMYKSKIILCDFAHWNDRGWQIHSLRRTQNGIYWNLENDKYFGRGGSLLNNEAYRMTGADMSLTDCFNKITVRCSQYNIDNLLPDLNDNKNLININGPWESYQKRDCVVRQTHTGPQSVGTAYYKFYDHKDWKPHYYTRGTYLNDPPVEVQLEDRKRGDANYFNEYIMPSLMDYSFKSKKERLSKIDFKRYLTLFQMNSPKAWIGPDGTAQIEKNNYVPLLSTEAQLPFYNDDKVYLLLNYDLAKTFFINQPFMATDGSISNEIKKNEYYGYKIKKVEHLPNMIFELGAIQSNREGWTDDMSWWNGKEWQINRCTFEVGSEWLEDSSFFQTNVGTDNNAPGEMFFGSTGYKIELPIKYSGGRLYFAICNPKPQLYMETIKGDYGEGGNAQTWISNIDLSLVKENKQLWKDEDVVFENIINEKNVLDGPQIDLKVNSGNERNFTWSACDFEGRKEGNSNLMGFGYKTTEFHLPEEWIIKNYIKQYSTPCIKENVTVAIDGNQGDFNIFSIVQDYFWDKELGQITFFNVIGSEIDLAMDRQTVTLLEKK